MKGTLAAMAVIAAALAAPGAAHAQVILQNDSFMSGQQAGVQSGFHAGEIGASRFVAPSAGRTLNQVLLFFGGATTQQTITLTVWDDTAGGMAPGAELWSGDFQVTGNNENFTALDLTAMGMTPPTVPQQFRVGITFQHMGVPSIARDADGTIMADRNYIREATLGWVRSQTLGLTGDWIIRAIVSGAGTGPDAGTSGPDAGTSGPDGGGGPGPDGGVGGMCNGNGECPIGTFCDTTAHACTFECRNDEDCAGGECNSLGQCIGADGGAGGCCSTGAATTGGLLGSFGLASAVAALVTRRRRRR